MKTLRRVTLVLALGLILAPRGIPAADPANLNTIKEGDSVPAFTGRNLVGDEIDVGELFGKEVVVLAFWSIYCKPCVEEVSSLIRLQEEFGEEIEVIGINTDTELGVERIRKFISRFEEFEGKKINYENIYDEGNKISKLLGVSFLPTVLSVNTKGQVEKVFVRFEEKTEEEIFTGIRSILPSAEETTAAAEEDTMIFTVQAVAPLCGFYGPEGWVGSFTGNRELEVELDKALETAQSKATKLILREALLALGINLAEDQGTENCFSPKGVFLLDDPMKIRDSLTNLINELPLNRLIRTLETQEDFQETEYRVRERSRVNMELFRGILDTLGYETTPRTVTFSIVNINKLDQEMFEQILLRQSRFIGYYSFPTYTIYTTVDTFADEMEKMDLQGLRLFIEDISEDRIELEVWR
jgi:thiol-disulfide isomerase/thioredoxin